MGGLSVKNTKANVALVAFAREDQFEEGPEGTAEAGQAGLVYAWDGRSPDEAEASLRRRAGQNKDQAAT